MSVESELFNLLRTLVEDDRCYPDTTPDAPVFPCIVYQVVGGRAYDYLGRKLPECEHYRVQVNCWAKSRSAASALALQVRSKIIESSLWPYAQGVSGYAQPYIKSVQTLGQAVSLYEEPLKLYGTRQDFGLWVKVR